MMGGYNNDYDYDYDYNMAPQRGRPYGANLGSMGRNTTTTTTTNIIIGVATANGLLG